MTSLPPLFNPIGLSRRRFLQSSLQGSAALLGGVGLLGSCRQSNAASLFPPIGPEPIANGNGIAPLAMARSFDYGTIKIENGKPIREFRITASSTTLKLNSAVSYPVWDYNDRVPGPFLRATEGDRVRIVFLNQGGHAHTMHFHGFHSSAMDGIKPVRHNTAFIYEFDAAPYGCHLYHCHIAPVTRHISKGLHGLFIIDPKQGRPPADEIGLVMAGYDLNDDGSNELYAFNGIPNCYRDSPIQIYQNQLVRLYLLNLIEFDAAVTFHLHATFFQVYPTGMTLKPNQITDVITMGTAERHILEFSYANPGMYMFHPHQDAIAEAGCMGHFEVIAHS
jgi:manganese oxidase